MRSAPACSSGPALSMSEPANGSDRTTSYVAKKMTDWERRLERVKAAFDGYIDRYRELAGDEKPTRFLDVGVFDPLYFDLQGEQPRTVFSGAHDLWRRAQLT